MYKFRVTIKGNDIFFSEVIIEAPSIEKAIADACAWYDGLTIEQFIEINAKQII